MARRRTPTGPPLDPGRAMLELACGPAQYSEAQLREVWPVYRASLMDVPRPSMIPWAYWQFELGVEDPGTDPAEATRLLEEYQEVAG